MFIFGRNFLWDDCGESAMCSFYGKCNAAQAEVQKHVISNSVRMLERLQEKTATVRQNASHVSHPDLKAEAVEMSESACTCDAMGLVGATLRVSLADDGRIFGNVAEYRAAVPHYSGKSRAE